MNVSKLAPPHRSIPNINKESPPPTAELFPINRDSNSVVIPLFVGGGDYSPSNIRSTVVIDTRRIGLWKTKTR